MGLRCGLIREIFSLALWALAIWISYSQMRGFSVHLDKLIPVQSIRLLVAFLVIFIGVLSVGGLIAHWARKLTGFFSRTDTDKLAGLLFGVARGVLISAALIFLAGMTPLSQNAWWQQSRLIPPIQAVAFWLKSHIPADLVGYVVFP